MNEKRNTDMDFVINTDSGSFVLERSIPQMRENARSLLFKDKSKTKASILRFFLENSNLSIEVMAEYLGCQTQSLRNKLARNTVSLDDLIIAAYACDYSVSLHNNKTEEDFYIDVRDYFDADKATQTRLEHLKSQADISYKRREYERLKAYVSEMEKKYGFSEEGKQSI